MSKKIIKTVWCLLGLWIAVALIFTGIRSIWSSGIASIASGLLGSFSFGGLSYTLWKSFYKLVTGKGDTNSKKKGADASKPSRKCKTPRSEGPSASKPIHKLKMLRAVKGVLSFCFGVIFSFFAIYFIILLFGDSAAIVSGNFSTTTGKVENIHYQSAKGGGYYRGDVNGIEFSIPESFYEGENVEITYMPMSKIIIRYSQK